MRYSGAAAEAVAFAEAHGVPVVETVAGRTLVPHDHPLYGGALGIVGSASANALAAEADLVLAVGTRLQDFTTSSWTGFSEDVRVISVNAARFDAVKRGAEEVVGDAREVLVELSASLGSWVAPSSWTGRAAEEKASWDAEIDRLRAGVVDGTLTYAQVTGVVNDASGPDDYVLTASGGMPGELHGGWRTGKVTPGATSGATMDLEYGFSCMGYEIVAPWGAAMARARTHPDGLVTSIFGDGSYLMLNSELYSAAFAGVPYVAVLCDNAGFAVIHRLQTGQGADGFNNLLADSRGPGAAARVSRSTSPRTPRRSAATSRPSRTARSSRSGRRTPPLGPRPSPSSARQWWSVAWRSPLGPSPAPGGRPARPRRCPATRRTTRERRARSAGSETLADMRLTFMAGREEPLRQLLAFGAFLLSLLVVISGFVADGWQWGALGVAVGVPGVVLPQVARRKPWSKPHDVAAAGPDRGARLRRAERDRRDARHLTHLAESAEVAGVRTPSRQYLRHVLPTRGPTAQLLPTRGPTMRNFCRLGRPETLTPCWSCVPTASAATATCRPSRRTR